MYGAYGPHGRSDFNNNMATAAVFLNVEEAFNTTWRFGLLHELSELKFPNSLIKLISSSCSEKIQTLGQR
jgi:hypothetical protein